MLTTIPAGAIPQFFNAQDKIEHFFAYFVLGIFIILALHFQGKSSYLRTNGLLVSLFLIMSYAAIDEIHQIFIPGRQADILDWVFDFIGGGLGILIVHSFIKKIKLKKE